MKTTMSPEVAEVTPSKKKLKQAQLPFKLISEVSPTPKTTSANRKRKLSTPELDSITKISKVSDGNHVTDLPVIVIDDDSKDGTTAEKSEKLPNPYVKLVDTAWKKKMQKSKCSKKRKGNKKITKYEVVVNGSVEPADEKTHDVCELMEVDEPAVDHLKESDGAFINTNKAVTLKETENNVYKLKDDSDNNMEKDLSNSIDAIQTVMQNGSISQKSDIDEGTILTISTDAKSEILNDINIEDINSNKEDSAKESPQSSDLENDKHLNSEELKTPERPKRNARRKAKQEENNNSKGESSGSTLNGSMTSIVSTPTNSKSSSVTKLDESLNESIHSSNLTPKQLQKKQESAKKRDEREKEKQDREKKRQQEKEERARQRQEKEDQKKREREEKEEAKRKEKEEKEELKRKEKEEKDKIKELEKKQREEKEEQKRKEKEEKEEQKRKEKETREEERRKKQEALELEKQEQELKKKKTAEAFVSFFVSKQKVEKDQPTVGTVSNNMLTNFTLKADMRLAPTTRTNLSEEKAQELVRMIKEQDVKENDLYLKTLKKGSIIPLCSGKTWPHCDKDDDDVILVEDELPPIDGAGEIITCEPSTREKLRPKLLSFHENRRPPYWGTWRKKSSFVKPRKPFGQDEKQLDYEVDSDEEWEEEQEGESIDGSAAGSDDEQGPDEYEVDNEVFVPHGYLSDEEATMDEDDVLSLSPETQKAKLKHLEDEFESAMKKPTEKLKPRLYGLLWETSDGGKPDNCVDAIWNYFGKLSMILNDPTSLLQPSQEPVETEKKKVKKKKATTSTDGEQIPKTDKKKRAKPQEIESKDSTQENNKFVQEAKKNQPGINMFLTKLKST